MAADLAMFRKGDLVKVKYRGEKLPGFWHFISQRDGIVSVRRTGRASPRYLDEREVELVDHDARW